jgi:hypothetical protein
MNGDLVKPKTAKSPISAKIAISIASPEWANVIPVQAVRTAQKIF